MCVPQAAKKYFTRLGLLANLDQKWVSLAHLDTQNNKQLRMDLKSFGASFNTGLFPPWLAASLACVLPGLTASLPPCLPLLPLSLPPSLTPAPVDSATAWSPAGRHLAPLPAFALQ